MESLKTRVNWRKKEATVWTTDFKYRLGFLSQDELEVLECGITAQDFKGFKNSIIKSELR